MIHLSKVTELPAAIIGECTTSALAKIIYLYTMKSFLSDVVSTELKRKTPISITVYDSQKGWL